MRGIDDSANQRKGKPITARAKKATSTYKSAVPKSGCKKIHRKTGKIKKISFTYEPKVGCFFSAIYDAKTNARKGLRISENCRRIPKISIHRTDPLLSIPITRIIPSMIKDAI